MSTSVSATVTQSVSMMGAPFSSVSRTIVGTSSGIIEKTYGIGDDDATGAAYVAGELQFLYLLSDSSDGTVTFTGTTGTDTVDLKAGVAQIFDIDGGDADPTTGATGSVVISFENTGGAITDLHGRMIYDNPAP